MFLCLEKLEHLALSFPYGTNRLEARSPCGLPAPSPKLRTCLVPFILGVGTVLRFTPCWLTFTFSCHLALCCFLCRRN